jgi:hypothetical protein
MNMHLWVEFKELQYDTIYLSDPVSLGCTSAQGNFSKRLHLDIVLNSN